MNETKKKRQVTLTSVQSEQERLRVVQLTGVPSEAGARERSRSGQSLGGS